MRERKFLVLLEGKQFELSHDEVDAVKC